MSSITDLLIKNVQLPDGRITDISIDNGLVSHVGAGGRARETADGTGLLCLPGAVDMHVHMRGGSQARKEDWTSGTISAVAGGVTMVVDQPNPIPPITSSTILERRIQDAEQHAYCNFAVNAGVTPEAAIEDMWQSGAMAFGEIFAAESSYGTAIGPEALKEALVRIHALGALATVHAEEVLSGTDDSLEAHNTLRSPAGEGKAVGEVCSMCPPGMKIHFCHLSSTESIDIAGKYGVSFEVMPHHLFLSLDMFDPEDGFGKVNPPIRSREERKRMWSYWDTIPVIASDHAPHTKNEKSGDFIDVPSGIPGVETMVPLLLSEVYSGRITLSSVLEKTLYTPAQLLGIQVPGFAPGMRADFALYPKSASPIDSDELHSRAGWSPYDNMDAVFPETVIVGGQTVMEKGEFHHGAGRWLPGQGYISEENQR